MTETTKRHKHIWVAQEEGLYDVLQSCECGATRYD